MAQVTINNVKYDIPEVVYEWMRHAREIITKTKATREVQREYFRGFSKDVLKRSKAMEKELDNLLEGRTPQQQAEQAELFR